MKKQSKGTDHRAKHDSGPLQHPKRPKESDVIQLVWELAEPICTSEGMELVHVEYQREPGGRILRIYIDRPGGVVLDDCAMVSRQIGDILDVHMDSNMPAYHLEVSSPGSQRPLSRLSDFERFKGQKAKIKIKTPIEGQRNFTGVLDGCTKEVVHLQVGALQMDIVYQNIAKAKLVNHNGEY
jgi:ribosome maturation factor RimP